MALVLPIVCALLGAALIFSAAVLAKQKDKAKQERSKLEQILLAVSDPMLVVDSQRRVEMLNRAAERLAGWPIHEAEGRLYQTVYNVDAEVDAVAEALQGRPRSRKQVALRTKAGEEVLVSDHITPLWGKKGKVLGVLCTFKQVGSRENQWSQLAQLSFRDALTGLYNRRYFQQELPRLDHPDFLPLSMIVGDLNGLKLTNDIFGHSMGDQLLIAVSNTLLAICRPSDRVFRWGGDEFIVLLPKTGAEEAKQICDRIRRALDKQAVGAVALNMPLGCATKSEAGEDIHMVWQRAEEEMYWAKSVEQGLFQKATLDRITKELYSRSEAEKEHAERVSSLAEQFGRHLGLPCDELRNLRLCGLLHDIGKVALEPQLLYRPYPLSPEEAQEMKRHPLVGFRLLTCLEDTADLAPAVLAHHECWDGSGYPRGLKGDEIPYFSRILSIIETYDRVCDASADYALELIAAGAGSKFDPELAEAFVQMMDQPSAAEVN
ncbi:MAG: diguanylate cyclase [Bacillota bacterium]|nr:diguanylate cyclase [Bacillota bacterium]